MRHEKNEDGILCYMFDSLQEFLYRQIEYYYPHGGTQSPIHGMLYRGLSDETYELVPTAHRWDDERRQLVIFKYHRAYSDGMPLQNGTERLVASAELAGLKTFFAEANRQGCNLPHSYTLSNGLFREYNNKYMESMHEWYTPDVIELAALAQHSGFPTRLLDWTYDINVALYFATQGIIHKLCSGEKVGEHYVIWCIDANRLGLFNDHLKEELPVEFFVPNYADNPNLGAQAGVLAYNRVCNMDEPFSVKPMDKVITEHYKTIGYPQESFFIKLIFPTKDVVSDFKYLHSIGYHAAKLFPGYNGVMRKIQEDEQVKKIEKEACPN